ncbi:MAG: AAA family ATPase [Clostridia bacterium]|nr:AAA family ATPase [Clostridia bacterium]
MEIPNNVLKHYLQNAFLICGTPCGGKTTIAQALAEKHRLLFLDEDTLNESMSSIADPKYQPAWCSRPTDWDVYFNRPYKEYHEWLRKCLMEQFPLSLLEITRASSNQAVVADLINMPVSMALELTERNRIVFLVTTPEIVVRDYLNRPSHEPIRTCVMGTSNPEASLANLNKMLAYSTELYLNELKKTDLFYVMRDENSTIESTLTLVEKHFGLK